MRLPHLPLLHSVRGSGYTQHWMMPLIASRNSVNGKKQHFRRISILTFSANLAVKKTQEDLDFLEWPPKLIHSVPVPKWKKMYWFWWSTDHFYFPLSFFYENLDFFYEWWNWTVENHKWCYNFATKWPVVGLNGWKPCSNLAEVENNQIRLLLTSPRAKLELLHSILAKNLNFP